jgi:hypothetical protein
VTRPMKRGWTDKIGEHLRDISFGSYRSTFPSPVCPCLLESSQSLTLQALWTHSREFWGQIVKLSTDCFLMKILLNIRDCYLHFQQAFMVRMQAKSIPPLFYCKTKFIYIVAEIGLWSETESVRVFMNNYVCRTLRSRLFHSISSEWAQI